MVIYCTRVLITRFILITCYTRFNLRLSEVVEINLRPFFLIQTILLAKQSSPTSTAIFENVCAKLGGRLSFSKLKMLIKMLISNYDLTLRSYYFCYATLLHISHKKMYIIFLKFLHIRYEFLLTRLIHGRPRITT